MVTQTVGAGAPPPQPVVPPNSRTSPQAQAMEAAAAGDETAAETLSRQGSDRIRLDPGGIGWAKCGLGEDGLSFKGGVSQGGPDHEGPLCGRLEELGRVRFKDQTLGLPQRDYIWKAYSGEAAVAWSRGEQWALSWAPSPLPCACVRHGD